MSVAVDRGLFDSPIHDAPITAGDELPQSLLKGLSLRRRNDRLAEFPAKRSRGQPKIISASHSNR